MKIKRFLAALLALATFTGSTAAFAAGTAGTSGDPLITKSYADNTYPTLVLTDPVDMLVNSITVLKYKLDQVGTPKAGSHYTVTAMPGGSISIITGGSFVLLSGGARLNSCTGTLIDLTDGREVSLGQELLKNHQYVAGENTTASAALLSTTKLDVYGSIAVVGSATSKFKDVTEDKWFFSDVSYAVQKGLVDGITTTTYEPDWNLTIAQAIKLAACMHQLYNEGSVSLKNDPAMWYMSYVNYALSNGIITGSYGNYDAKISRSEFVKIFHSSLPSAEYGELNTISDNAIPDVKMTDAVSKEIYAFYRAGILTGKDNAGSFLPKDNILRSEVAAIMTRMFEKSARKQFTLPQ